MKILRAPRLGGFNNIKGLNIADVGVRRTFATYVDVEGIDLVLIRVSPGPNSALTLQLTLG